MVRASVGLGAAISVIRADLLCAKNVSRR
jgi:hypothetical protein